MLLNVALHRALFHVEPGDQRRQRKEENAQIAGESLEDVRCLRTEKVFRHATAERCAESLILRPLHENEQDDQKRGEDFDDQ